MFEGYRFKINGLIFRYKYEDEEKYPSTLEVEFTPEFFFNRPELFYWGGKPSDTRLKKFYETLRNLATKRKPFQFFVDSAVKPSSTNLALKLRFPLNKIGKIDEIFVKDLIEHLDNLWQWICNVLQYYSYDICRNL